MKECWAGETCTKNRLDGIKPIQDPAVTSKLLYRVTIDGIEAAALLDYGAMCSFIDKKFLSRNALPTRPIPKPIQLRLLKGQSPHEVRERYLATRLTIATQCFPWEFLVLEGLPHEVVLGMEFVKRMHVMYDPYTDLIFVGGPSGHPPSTLADANPVKNFDDPDKGNVGEVQATFLDIDPVGQPMTSPLVGGYALQAFEEAHEGQQRVHLLSVTAASLEERVAVEQFRTTLSPDLQKIVHASSKLFDPPDREPPERSVKHRIELLPDTVPIKRRPYPLAALKLKEMKEQVTALVSSSWVEPSSSPWGAPILFVPKKDQALRIYVDFQDLNAVTVDDSYPLPRIEVVLHRAAQATVFSKIDLASGFHQIEVEPESRPLTAFRLPEPVCGSSLWQWKVMPFGLRNAPPMFQRAMGVALEGCEHCSVVYIDDILIFSRTRQDHLQHLQLIFERLTKHAYHARLAKCEFMQDEVGPIPGPYA